ncbi:hypothetical protein OU995_11805 [Roseateles sp. SL47]|uniref:hypothetical protein n=1 Tax=Roseateles sp. SL47 TaxID=2995138 RepID=UPI0022712BF2|nr:hypothetical protein [Roseateles sp. SL47]WAC75333.1 hypothetical protein OU995_11805 [Roseateles sp. SL47]
MTFVVPLANHAFSAYVDDIDAEAVMRHRWYFAEPKNGCMYARATVGGTRVMLHRFIADLAGIEGQLIDHRNRFGLDCQRDNLRAASYSENNVNRTARSASGHPGVFSAKGGSGWVVRFRKDRKDHYFGFYRDLDEACAVARAAMKQVYGEFAPFEEMHFDGEVMGATVSRLVQYMQTTGDFSPLRSAANQVGFAMPPAAA